MRRLVEHSVLSLIKTLEHHAVIDLLFFEAAVDFFVDKGSVCAQELQRRLDERHAAQKKVQFLVVQQLQSLADLQTDSDRKMVMSILATRMMQTQEAWIPLDQALHHVDRIMASDAMSLRAMAKVSAKHAMIDGIRRAQRRVRAGMQTVEDAITARWEEEVNQKVDALLVDLATDYDEAVASLIRGASKGAGVNAAMRYADVGRLIFFGGAELQDLAKSMGLTHDTMNRTVSRARTAISRHASERLRAFLVDGKNGMWSLERARHNARRLLTH